MPRMFPAYLMLPSSAVICVSTSSHLLIKSWPNLQKGSPSRPFRPSRSTIAPLSATDDTHMACPFCLTASRDASIPSTTPACTLSAPPPSCSSMPNRCLTWRDTVAAH